MVNIDPDNSEYQRIASDVIYPDKNEKKCACGWTGTKHMFYKHMKDAEKQYNGDAKAFWNDHGEVPNE